MSDLIRLVYASRSNSDVPTGAVDPAVGSILAQSRRNNQQQAIGGVLFFGDGYFFQCLEGEASAVQATYERILLDERHRDARILLQETVATRLFARWSMKFVPTAEAVQALLQQHGHRQFAPFEFSPDFTRLLLQQLQQAQAQQEPMANTAVSTPWWKRLKSAIGS